MTTTTTTHPHNPFANIEAAIQNFKNHFLNWVASEEAVIEEVGTELIHAIGAILTAVKPTVVKDVRAILLSLPNDFRRGATFSDIVEEVKNQAHADLKTVLNTVKPQILEATVGVLVNSLPKV